MHQPFVPAFRVTRARQVRHARLMRRAQAVAILLAIGLAVVYHQVRHG